MVGSMVGMYNGKIFNQVEIKPETIGHYLSEFVITSKSVKQGRLGIGATHFPTPRLLLPPQVAVANEDSHLVPGGGGMIVVLQRWLSG